MWVWIGQGILFNLSRKSFIIFLERYFQALKCHCEIIIGNEEKSFWKIFPAITKTGKKFHPWYLVEGLQLQRGVHSEWIFNVSVMYMYIHIDRLKDAKNSVCNVVGIFSDTLINLFDRRTLPVIQIFVFNIVSWYLWN